MPQLNTSKVPTLSDFLDCSIGQINSLVQGVATGVGCIMALATGGPCAMWLLLTTPKVQLRRSPLLN